MKLGLSALLLAGCQTSTDPDDAGKKNDPDYVLVRAPKDETTRFRTGVYQPTANFKNGDLGPALQGVWQYGLLAADEYYETENRTNRLNPKCDFHSRYTQRWQRLPQYSYGVFEYKNPDGRIAIPGFSYGVWKDTSVRHPAKLAIVFRGTNFTEWGDWYSNARWITRFNPTTFDQYQQTRELIDQLVPALQAKFGNNVQIVAVGHSLGGGLAQHAGYSSGSVSRVYAFASSPVVGYRDKDERINAENRKGLEIYRINESGEILAAGRWIHRNTAGLSPKNPKSTELLLSYRSAFYKRQNTGDGPISQHSVSALSCSMICQIEHGHSEEICKEMDLKMNEKPSQSDPLPANTHPIGSGNYRTEAGLSAATLLAPAILIVIGLYLSYETREAVRNAPDVSEATQVYLDALRYMPVVSLGYVFGLLGGLFRSGLQLLKGEASLEARFLVLQIGIGGIIGIVSTFVIEHSVISFFVTLTDEGDTIAASEIPNLALSYNGVALVSFLAAFFSTEIVDRVRSQIVTPRD